MKYKAIAKYCIGNEVVMNPGDIIVINGSKVYNMSTKMDFNNLTGIDSIKAACLKVLPDELGIISDSLKITDVDRFKNITDKMLDIFKRKNSDYGNSFEQSLNEEGLTASRIRIGDKWNRFKNLSKNKENQVKDESLRDTLIDMANYCIMTTIWLDKQAQKK